MSFANVSAANLTSIAEPHAQALEACARAMDAAGIGGHADGGHVATLYRLAADMRAQAALGRVPYIYRGDDRLHAGDDLQAASESPAKIAALSACADAGIEVPAGAGGKFASMDALDMQLNTVFDRAMPGYFEKRVALKNTILKAGLVVEPEKPVDEPAFHAAVRLLKKHGIPVPTKYMLTVADIDAAAEKAKLSISERINLKVYLERAGLLDLDRTAMAAPLPRPGVAVARNIFASLDLDPPAPGRQVSLATLNAALTAKGIDTRRRIEIKNTPTAAGALAA